MLASREKDRISTSFEAPLAQGATVWTTTTYGKWSETKFEYCVLALSVLSLGSSLLRRFNRLDLVDGASLARGIFRCSLAAGMVHQRLQEVERCSADLASRQTSLENNYLTLLASSLAESVEQEVLLAIMFSDGSSKENNAGRSQETAIATAISISGLQDATFLSPLTDGTARTELLSALSKDIVQGIK